MKKLFAIAFLILLSATMLITAATCQVFGIAGTNSAAILTPEVRAYMTELTVDTLGFCIRDDKELTYLPANESQNIIDWDHEMKTDHKTLLCIYTFHCAGKSISDNFHDFDLLIAAGVKIPVVKLGNENYFESAGNHSDFNNYLSFANPIIDQLNARGYNGIIIIPVSGGNTAWDDPVAAFIKDKPNYQLDPHFYWGKRDLACYSQLTGTEKDLKLPSAVVGTAYLLAQDKFYSDLYSEITSSTMIESQMQYYTSKFPGKILYLSEFGPAGNVGNLQNTLGFQATEDWFYNQIQRYDEVAYCLKFNGPSPSGTGMISPRSSKDDPAVPGAYMKRLSYYTLYQFLRNKKADNPMYIDYPGEYTFSFHNMTRMDVPIEIDLIGNLRITSITYDAIHGDNFYSSSGSCQWWGNGSTKTYQISGKQTFSTGIFLSYGYVHVKVELIPVYGCTDPAAINFNELANTDDLSCYYFEDCGCKDLKADNYNEKSPCENNLICRYPDPPPTVCYKKRWLFAGCKIDPSCKVNNCKQ